MSDPTSPGEPFETRRPDEAPDDDRAERSERRPPNTAWSLPPSQSNQPGPGPQQAQPGQTWQYPAQPGQTWQHPNQSAAAWQQSEQPTARWETPGAAGRGWYPPPGGGWASQQAGKAQPADQWGPPPHRRHLFARVAVGALLVATAAFLAVAVSHDFWRSPAATPTQSQAPAGGSGASGANSLPFGGGSSGGSSGSSSGTQGTQGGSTSVAAIAARVNPAIVDINVTLGYQSGRAAATGVVLTSNGLVLTNNHVIDGATTVRATPVGTSNTYPAQVVGYDATDDVALLQLQGASGLPVENFGNSSQVGPGHSGARPRQRRRAGRGVKQGRPGHHQRAQPLDPGQRPGLRHHRRPEPHAADQRPDRAGRLRRRAGPTTRARSSAWITAASSSYSFQSTETQGFAVPINTATSIAAQITAHRSSATVHIGPTAFLGVQLDPTYGQGGFGGQGGTTVSGATISGTLAGSPAAQAGLSGGDVIVSVDGTSVGSGTDLSSVLGQYQPGDKVTIGWIDQSGSRHSSSVQLATGPPA